MKIEEVDVVEPLERIARRELETVVPWKSPGVWASEGGTDPRSVDPVRLGALFGEVDVEPARRPVLPEIDPVSGRLILAEVEDPTADLLGPAEEELIAAAEAEPEDDLLDLLRPADEPLTVAGGGTLRPPVRPDRRPFDPVQGGVEDGQLTLASVIADTRYALPDPDSLESKPYRLKWSPDFIGAAPFFASNVGFAGTAQIAISDILSNHVIQIGASIYGSFDSSDLFVGYYNLAHRTNWGLAAYQYRNDFGIYTASNEVNFESNIYRGVQGLISRPFSKWSRIEFVARGVAINERVFQQSFETTFLRTEETSSGMLYYGGVEVALVTDNVVWGYYGPMHGRRARISTEQAMGDIQFNTTILDYRHYFAIGRSTSFAVRLIGGASTGNTPQLFRIGGPTTLRGVDYGQFVGHSLALFNAELRFPLVETLRLGWPLRVGLGGVGGVLFFDVGSAWFRTDRLVRNNALNDAAAGYGVGFRLGLGYFALKYDIAQRFDFRHKIGGTTNYFSIGTDF